MSNKKKRKNECSYAISLQGRRKSVRKSSIRAPAGAVTLTDKYGVRLSNQNGLGNNGKTEYFTLDGHYKVLERSGNAVKVQIDQEPVWLQTSFAE